MDKNLVNEIIIGLQEKKGFEIITADLSEIETAPAKYFVICSGNTPQQVAALTESVEERVRIGMAEKPAKIVGLRNSQWVAMDYGTVMVHIFVPEAREHYDLEHLWNDATMTKIPEAQ